MRKFYFFIIVVVLIIQSSCSKDEVSIVGEWKPTFQSQTECGSLNFFYEFTNGCTTSELGADVTELCFSFNFKPDGTIVVNYEETYRESGNVVDTEVQTILGLYKINGSKIKICLDEGEGLDYCDDIDEEWADFELTESCLTLIFIEDDECRVEWRFSR